MNATVSEQVAMSPDQAVREILRIEGHSESLLHRTIGLTWMIWALVSGGIFVSYEAIGIAAPAGELAILGYGSVWVPWVLLGSITTTFLWRSLALVIPQTSPSSRWVNLGAITTFLALVLGGLAVVTFTNVPVSGPAWAMFAIGIGAAVVGGSGWTTDSRSERTLWLAGGIALVTLTVAIALVAGRTGFDSLGLLLVLGPVASTALLFGGGLYTALS